MATNSGRNAMVAGWLGLSLLSLAGWGIWGFVQKPLTDRTDVWSIVFVESATTLSLALLSARHFKDQIGLRQKGVAIALVAGVFGYAGGMAFLAAIDRGAASIVVPLTSMYPLVTILLSYVFLRESLARSQQIGVVLALAAIFFLSR